LAERRCGAAFCGRPAGLPYLFDAPNLGWHGSARFSIVGQYFRKLDFMKKFNHTTQLRVRYSETDQMGTFYNSRALEWFECGRTELMRHQLGMSYAALEAKGVFLPLVEAHLEFPGGARYDDLLDVATTVEFSGRAKLRFEVQITQNATGKPVVRGYTVHAFTDVSGKPIRPPPWFVDLLEKSA
jgi:acyl-CoA thioester hydrolase